MNRWKIVGIASLLFLILLAFTIVDSCRRVNEPQRAEEDPETLDSQVHPSTVPSDTPASVRRTPHLPSMQQIAV